MKTQEILKTVFCVLLLFSLAYAQSIEEYDSKINQSSKNLKEIEKQISALKNEVEKYQKQEQNITRDMDNTQRQISLTNEKIRLQNRELSLRRAKKKQLEKDYRGAKGERELLLQRYERRVVRAYKLRPKRQFDLFVDATSSRQFYYRIKYISSVNTADRKLYQEIVDNIDLIDTKNTQIGRESISIAQKVKELEKEQNKLEKLKQEKEIKYKKILASKTLISQQIKDKEDSKKKIQNAIAKAQKDKRSYIARFEEERKRREIVELPFEQKKNKLQWPANGKIVSYFGKQKHPVLGTITENSGIEIATAPGVPVKAVSDGVVVTITWLRGFGNTIILLHDNNYYTVYSHIENIDVIQDEYVDAGQKLATVSSNASMDGSRLHFEIWHEQEKLNPTHWLRK